MSALAAGVPPLAASEFDVVIHEIHFNPLSGLDADEFIELYNRGGTTVDLSGWAFIEGVQLLFPAGTLLGPKEYLLASPDADYTSARYGVDDVVGDYTGRLDNGGELLTLVSASGDVVSRLHWGDGGTWPSSPDGLGPSLEFRDPHADPYDARFWQASRFVDGTPGAANSSAEVEGGSPAQTVLVRDDEVWRYLKGTQAFPATWRQLGFNDGAWLSGPTGIGYDDGDDRTVLADMQNGYVSFAARKTFSLTAAQLDASVDAELVVDYDDGFVAFLNGTEFARANMPSPPGSAVNFDVLAAGTHEAGQAESFAVPRALFQVGQNVLAVQVHNQAIDSSDSSFIPSLVSNPSGGGTGPASELAAVVVNEVQPTGSSGEGFIELLNRSAEAQSVGSFRLIDTAGHAFTFAPGTSIPAGLRLVVTSAQLGYSPSISQVTHVLVEADGRTYVDGFATQPGRDGEDGFSFGRFPDGDDDGFVLENPSPGGPNAAVLSSAVVIHEFYFHPPFVAPDVGCPRNCSDREQWVELHNRSASQVDISGWSLSKAVDFTFAADTRIAAAGFLVVASDRDRFLALHPGFPAASVVGNWEGNLSHSTDTINLRDDLANLVDHVRYGDGSPRNDEDPEDGVDDRTLRSSEWPRNADGSGRTLELIHPALDNRHGGAWTEGPIGGTPGAANAAFRASPLPVVGDVSHSPVVPGPGQEVLVTCSVSAAGGTLSSVRALWRVEGGGPSGNATLRDDGLSGDGAAGDGSFGGRIPAQANQAVVAFQVEARMADGRTTLVPLAPPVAPYTGFQGPYFLYQVLSASPPANGSASYYVVLSQADLAEITNRPVESDVLLHATFISRPASGRDEVRHLVGLRFRGSGTRDNDPKSYRLDFPPERAFGEIEHLNLNATIIEGDLLASDFFRRAGMPGPQEWTVNLTFQGTLNTRYVRKERIDGAFLSRFFGGLSDGGNLYRALNPEDNASFPLQGDLNYLGPDPTAYPPYYSKETNEGEDDYTDLVELTRAFDRVETPDSEFVDRVESLIDANQWARFFAAQACLSNEDGGIQNISGEDYFLYRVPAESNRLDAGKWILVPWDLEESYANDAERLFRPTLPAVQRFLTHPRFAPLYYCHLINLRSGVFSRLESRQRFRLISPLFGFSTIDGIDSFITARIGFIDENVPMRLTAGTGAVGGSFLIAQGDAWRYFKGLSEPSGGTLNWTQLNFVDGSWSEGTSGIGYGDGDDATVLTDMENGYTTVYARRRFDVPNAAAVLGLDLVIDYDDAFVAYLNGVEVARAGLGASGSQVSFDATGGAHEAGTPETFDISAFLGALRSGTNVLAVQGVNAAIDSSDFSLIPELRIGGTGGAGGLGCGSLLFATESTVGLTGFSNACLTARIEVNGVPADYDPFLAEWEGSVAVGQGDTLVTVEAFDAFGNSIETLEVVVRRLAGGFTSVAGNLAGNTSWTAAASPYLLSSTVTVPAGSTLTIGAGTQVVARGGASIIVRGRLSAQGTAASPILFRAAACESRWGGIAFDSTGTAAADFQHLLRYVDIEGGDAPAGFAGCVAPVSSKLLVDHSTFRSLTENAIDGTNARLEVRDSRFEAIHEGVHCTRSTVIVLDSVFQGMVGDKDAIDFDFNGTERSRIERCLFLDGSDDGVDLASTTVDIRDNVFVNIQDKALSLEENGPLGAPTITGNVLSRCGTAIALKDGVTITVGHNNTVVGNQEGINLFAKAGAPDGGHGTFDSMILWDNAADVMLDALSSVSFTYSDISDALWPGQGNITSDPRFSDQEGGSFALRADSPCIGTGLNGVDMGAIPFGGTRAMFVRGDVDANGQLQLTDPVRTLDHLFRGGAGPACRDRMDSNDDGGVDVSDAVYTLLFLFGGGTAPPAPFPVAGPDPTPDGLPCV